MKTSTLILAIITIELALLGSTLPNGGYVAHEWGTFTSVQGADGVPLEWNPLTSSQLPGFVHDWSKPLGDPRRHLTGFGGKTAFRTLQRMETPVIYFYADSPQTVDVTVKFPQGLVTEWYPQVTEIGPSAVLPRPALAELDRLVAKTLFQPHPGSASLDTRLGIADSHIRWAEVRIRPTEKQAEPEPQLPTDETGSHYYSARETGGNLLGVQVPVNGAVSTEYERFLFYRGIGSFPTPLQVSLAGDENQVRVRNGSAEALTDLIVLNVKAGRGECAYVDRLRAGEAKTVTLGANDGTRELGGLADQISGRMTTSLIEAGLYPREAEAMVKTWRESWFAEPGTRVLYVLPRPWTDQILPITLKPAPGELVRVMVGRAELLTPETEGAVLQEIVRFSAASEQNRDEVVEATRLLGLGRFLEPAILSAAQKLQKEELNKAAWELLEAATPRRPASRSIAARQ
jgi:hypothetical protein